MTTHSDDETVEAMDAAYEAAFKASFKVTGLGKKAFAEARKAAMRAALAVVREREGWRKIEDGPPDPATEVILYHPNLGQAVHPYGCYRAWDECTHWRYPPAPPEGE